MTDAAPPTPADAAPLPDRLPLSTVERYMLDDDRPSHPMTGVHELVVRGPLDADQLADAVEATRRRHPLLCRIIDDSGAVPAWIPAPADAAVAIDRAPAGTPRTHPRGDWLDVRREVGLRIWVRDEAADADGAPVSRLSVAIHHCVADALGGITFLIDLFAHLSAANGGPPPPPAPDVSRLFRRGEFFDRPGLLPGLPKGRLGLWGHMAIGLRRLNGTRTLPLVPTGAGNPVSVKPALDDGPTLDDGPVLDDGAPAGPPADAPSPDDVSPSQRPVHRGGNDPSAGRRQGPADDVERPRPPRHVPHRPCP